VVAIRAGPTEETQRKSLGNPAYALCVQLSPEEYKLFRAHVAVHEAAHTVAAIDQGMPVALISMSGEGDPGERTAAYTNFGDHAAYELMAEHPDAMGPVLLAGASAEMYFFNGAHVREGYARDIEVIQSHIGPARDLEHAMAMLQPWVDRARQIVRERRPAIETIAAELMTADGLSRAQIDDLLEQSNIAPRYLPSEVLPPATGESEGGTGGGTA
jgi:ATP-dependent Zn protease